MTEPQPPTVGQTVYFILAEPQHQHEPGTRLLATVIAVNDDGTVSLKVHSGGHWRGRKAERDLDNVKLDSGKAPGTWHFTNKPPGTEHWAD